MKNWFTVTQLEKNIYALAEFSHWEKVVSYLLVDKNQAFLIDTGMGYASIRQEVEKITSLPVIVLLTHTHWDHIGSIGEFDDIYLYDNISEKENLINGFNSIKIIELNDKLMFEDGFRPKKYLVKGKKNFTVLKDQQFIHSENFDIQVLHTPGHTPGSVCFYISKLKALLTGDTLYPGPLYAQMPESSISDFIFSIKRLQKYAEPELKILPGHNEIISNQKLLIEAQKLFSRIKMESVLEEEIFGEHLSIKLK